MRMHEFTLWCAFTKQDVFVLSNDDGPREAYNVEKDRRRRRMLTCIV
jgi:hypothetical protein